MTIFFDILGRVKAHKQTTDGTAYTTSYAYNLGGALVDETYPSGRVVRNVLDANGDLFTVESKKNSTSGPFYDYAHNFVYNAAGAVTSMELGNGRYESTIFNSRLQPTQIALGTTATSFNSYDLLKLNYSYGTTANNGNVLSQTITVPGMTNSLTQNYSYDSLNRLATAVETSNSTPTWKQKFTYDRYGNRRFDFTNGDTTVPVSNCVEATCNPTVSNANNRLTSSGYNYDSSGNITYDAALRKFTYDAENKQTKAESTNLSQSVTGTLGEYFYDGDGKRVKKYVPSTGETTIFVYDASGKQIAEYSTIVANSTDAKVSYLTSDHLGSPRIHTDRDGNITSRHDYLPFGEEIDGTGGRTTGLNYGVDTVRKQFTGYERDTESDLDFAEARMYANKLGRFTAVDPGPFDPLNPQVMNRYSYVVNNPLKYMDPDGRKARLTGTAAEIEEARIYLQNTSGFKLEVDKKGNVKVVGTIESKTASKDFATELKTILDDKKTATYNVVSEVEAILVDDGNAASDENRPQNIDINDIKQIAKDAPELGAALTIHALREGLELAKGNKYNAQSQMLANGTVRETSPSAHDIALKAENRVMSGISGTTQERGRDPVIADRKEAAYDFKYTTVTYTVKLIVRGTEKDAITVTKRKN